MVLFVQIITDDQSLKVNKELYLVMLATSRGMSVNLRATFIFKRICRSYWIKSNLDCNFPINLALRVIPFGAI